MQQKSNHSNTGNKGGKKKINWDRYISKEAGLGNKSGSKSSFGKSKFGGSKSTGGQTGSKFGGSKSASGQTGSKFGSKSASGQTGSKFGAKSTSGQAGSKYASKSNAKTSNTQESNSKFGTTKKIVKKVAGVKNSVAAKKANKVETLEMYYMSEKELTSKELLNSIEESDSVVVQVWEEIGVGSIEFGESGSVDFVKCNDVFEFQEDLDFLEEHHIKSAFEVTFEEKNMYVVAKWFLSIINEHGGFFCTDSDDFTPIYKKEELEEWR